MSAARKPTSRRKSASKTSTKRVPKKTSARSSAAKNVKKKATSRKSATAKTAAKKTAARKSTRKSTPRKTSTRTAKEQAAPRRSRARAGTRLDAKAVAKIREDLAKERRDLEAEMAELEEESFQATQSEITGEVGIDEDFADAGSATYDREQALSIANNIRDLIDQVDRAVGRIDEGTYGSCERCGRSIDAARLRALPRTLLCTDCKRREERAR